MQIDRSEIEVNLDEGDLRGIQLVQVGLVMGVVMFMGVVLVLTRTPTAVETPPDPQLFKILSGVNALLLLQGYPVAFFLFNALTKPKKIGPVEGPEDAVRKALGVFRSAMMLRAALLEGPALFGLVVIFLAHAQGALEPNAWIWANTLAPMLFLAATGVSFLTKKRLVDLIEDRLSKLPAQG